MTKLLYLVDENTPDFQAKKEQVKIVCVGDSITGWNNTRGTSFPSGPYRTYPVFLQESTDTQVADCGISGEESKVATIRARKALELFPFSGYFIIGYGTNDIPTDQIEIISPKVIRSLESAVKEIKQRDKRIILINVLNVNSRKFSKRGYANAVFQRQFHNSALREYATSNNIPLADICSVLRDEHFADAVHPNEEGAKLIAQEVAKLIYR
ncbi:SGNH/GDSL hydrolase family protein [Candidatus Pacearchaeota archaeon]|nr:SGNH/GDSL hydrolase family protein [Candidatus Pacearchaeota archaeon]